MTEAELIEILQSGDSAAIGAVLDRINGVGVTDPVYLRNMEKIISAGEYEDLQEEDPRIWKATVNCNVALRNDPRNRDVSDEDLSELSLQTARKKFGTEASRWMAREQARRRGLPAPDPFDGEVAEDDSTEFDQEKRAGETEGIEYLRQKRAGTPLSEIRKRAAGGNE